MLISHEKTAAQAALAKKFQDLGRFDVINDCHKIDSAWSERSSDFSSLIEAVANALFSKRLQENHTLHATLASKLNTLFGRRDFKGEGRYGSNSFWVLEYQGKHVLVCSEKDAGTSYLAPRSEWPDLVYIAEQSGGYYLAPIKEHPANAAFDDWAMQLKKELLSLLTPKAA